MLWKRRGFFMPQSSRAHWAAHQRKGWFFMPDWDPQQYLKFKKERTQPALDLAARLELSPAKALDVGCGPGNSTQVVAERFPPAQVLGLDAFDAKALHDKITAIRAEGNNTLVFLFKDGTQTVKRWADRSRAESWTPEMRAAAREFAKKGRAMRSCQQQEQ